MRPGRTKLIQGDGWIITLLAMAGIGIALLVITVSRLL